MLRDGQDDDLDRRDLRGQNQTVVVAVRHDNSADHTGGGAPGGLERVLKLIVAPSEGHIVSAGKLIAEVVGGRALEGLAVLHHALNGIGRFGAGELLLVGLAAADDGNGKDVFKEVGIAAQLLLGLSLCLLGGFVDGVSLLPPELTRAQERPRGLFPANDGAPLVVEHRQLAVGVQHIVPVVAEHGLGCGSEGKTLLQLLAAAHGHPCDLRGKAVDQLALLLQKALGDQNGHCNIDVTGLFEHAVHDVLNILPNGIAIGTQNGKALYGGILHQLRLAADVGIPLCKVDLHIGDLFHSLILCHFCFLPFRLDSRISIVLVFCCLVKSLPESSLFLRCRRSFSPSVSPTLFVGARSSV